MHPWRLHPETLSASLESIATLAMKRTARRHSRATLSRIDVRSQHGVHARQVAFAARLEPFDHIAVEAQVDEVFPLGTTTRADFQKLRAERLGFRGVSSELGLRRARAGPRSR